MTISNTTRNVVYVGNGSTRDFDFTFYTPSDEEIKVYILDIESNAQVLLADNQYTLELNTGNEGGTITYPKLDALDPTPITSAKKIIIQREVPKTQTLSLSAQSNFNPTVLEQAFDKLTLIVQELSEEVSRTFSLPPGSEIESISDLYTALNTAVGDAEQAASDAEATYNAFLASLSSYTNQIADGALIGQIRMWGGPRLPTRHLWCAGQDVSRTTYSALFAALCPDRGSVTISIASPAAITLVDHELSVGDLVRLSTTGVLPTGLAANTDYYVQAVVDANSFRLAATRGGAAINTSGSQSGTHSLRQFPHGAGDGSTTFTIPNYKGYGPFGRDNMGGTAGGRVTQAVSGIYGEVLGADGGAQSVTLLRSDLPNVLISGTTSSDGNHAHTYWDMPGGTSISTDFSGTFSVGSNSRTDALATSTDGAHTHTWSFNLNNGVTQTAVNKMPPTKVTNFIIYAGV